ncbi:MAG: histidine kinase N-terminal 7TM domain-containing protein [Anaerolineae bacterium]|nr:histidine kinase N-terminal 7TM domain-containing protein [Anaerolineae bacterium]
MTGVYVYKPDIWPSVLTTILLVVLSFYASRRRGVSGALPFAVGSLFAALWAAGAGMEVAATDVAAKIFWLKFQAAWQLPAITAITCFVFEYTWPGRWLTRRNLLLLSLVPLLYLTLILTNDLHHLAWLGFTFNGMLTPLRGPVTWLIIAYGYGLGIVNALLFAWLFLRSPAQRLSVALILVGQVGARVLYLLEATNRIRSPLPLDVLMLGYLFLVYAVALFGLRIFDPVPLARQWVIDQMPEGLIVLDPQGRVASLNPAAQAILGLPSKQILGHPAEALLPAATATLPDSSGNRAALTEIQQGTGPESRFYALESSALRDWRGLEVGRLLLLHDVTEEKRAQAELLKEERTQATLQERERLARELHDSLGQTLAATHLQASTARLLLAQGETAQTDRCLEEMAKMSIAAEADVRDYLLGAKTVFSADLSFFPALCLYLTRFSQQYGLPVALKVPVEIEAEGLAPVVEVQLMRIIQEALANVRKHAHAARAEIEFIDAGPLLQVTICDDGQGFDPGVVVRQADGYGLQSMRERADELGGNLQVIARVGQGTQVVVELPVNGKRGAL